MVAPTIPNIGPLTVTSLSGDELFYFDYGSQDQHRIKASDFRTYAASGPTGATGATGPTGPSGTTGFSGTITTASLVGKTVTVVNGLITTFP
jgi:hypothetical protein